MRHERRRIQCISSASSLAHLRVAAGKGNLKSNQIKSGNKSGSVRLFATQAAWARWLETNHRKSAGLWLRIAKKGSGVRSVTYAEALEVALCYGWIDGQKRSDSKQLWLQRFVPRSARSIWSKINRDKAAALITSGLMKPSGLEAIEAAKKRGRWTAAYDFPKDSQVPADFQKALDANPEARDFFRTLDRANRYAVLFRIQTVKEPETRLRKIIEFVYMLKKHESIHPPRKSIPTKR
jgi:uncharacterized protein YdeI (YjbR/CyaY-like superfamily)